MSAKPTAQGTLGKTPFAHLLLYAHDRRLTGTLAIWPAQNAAGGRGQDRLFLQHGAVVAMRPLTPHPSIEEALLGLFARAEGPYGFYADQNLLGTSTDILRGPVNTYRVLSHGLRLHARPEVVEALLARIGPRAIRAREGLPIAQLDLTHDQAEVVARLTRGKVLVRDLLAESGLEPEELRRLLYLLTLIRGIETAEDRAPLSGLTMETMPPAPEHRPPPSEPTERNASPLPPAPARSGASYTGANLLPAPAAPADLSPQDAERWNEIAALYDKLDDLNHYQLLGIERSASASQVQAAYFALVKKYHPDRLPSALSDLARCAHHLFERLTEANNTLSNPETRPAYDSAVAEGGGTRSAERMMRNVLDSTVEFQKAEILVKRRDFPQAMQHLRDALAKNPDDPDYHALYGWLLHLMNPTEPAPFEEIVAALNRALTSNPNSDRAHYYLGVVYKRMKRDREAERHFRSAMQINPRNVEAAREVRLATMRRESKAPPPPSGLLSKLFKGGKNGP